MYDGNTGRPLRELRASIQPEKKKKKEEWVRDVKRLLSRQKVKGG